MILAVARLPPGADAAALVAMHAGVAPAEARLRLAGVLPRIVLRDVDVARVERVAAALEAAGFATLRLQPGEIGSDADRVLVRRLELDEGGFTAFDGAERPHRTTADAIELIQVGVRTTLDVQRETTRSKQLSIGRAVVTGGLIMRKTVEKTSERRTETSERFAVVHRWGEPDLLLVERRLQYRFLGSAMQPSSLANFQTTVQRLRALAPPAFDDRVGRPGFVRTLPDIAADPVDLALHLVRLAHREGKL